MRHLAAAQSSLSKAPALLARGAVAGTCIAFGGESAYAQLLHEALAPEGIYVDQLIIPLGIGDGDLTTSRILWQKTYGVSTQTAATSALS